jgi:hypothetical protein
MLIQSFLLARDATARFSSLEFLIFYRHREEAECFLLLKKNPFS